MTSTSTLHGFHAVIARLRARPRSIRTIYVSSARDDRRTRDVLARARVAGCSVHGVDDAKLAELAGTSDHQGVVAVVDAHTANTSVESVLDGLEEPALLLVLDGVTDPHNLGACLRNADAFGAHAVMV